MSTDRRSPRVLIFSFLLVFFVGAGIRASGEPAAESLGEPWTIDDLLKGETVGQMEVTPDGKLAVWSVQGLQKVGKEEKKVAHLWARSLEGRRAEPVQLTRGDSGVGAFRISPDGSQLAFLTDRKIPNAEAAEGQQIWILPLTSGGEARPVSSFDRGVEGFEFIDDQTLLLLRPESKGALEAERTKEGDTSTAISDPVDNPPIRLFKLTLDGKLTRLSRNGGWIQQQAIAPDGKTAVIVVAQDLDFQFNEKVGPKTFLVDLGTGEWKELLAGTRLRPYSIRYSADSRRVYFADVESSHPLYESASIGQLHRYDLDSGETLKIELDWPRGLADGATPFLPLERTRGARSDDLLVLLADGVRNRPVRLAGRASGLLRQPLEGGRAGKIESWTLSRDGKTLLFEASSLTEPTQLYAARLEGSRLAEEKQVSKLNPFYEKKEKGRYEVVRFKGALGEEVEGIVLFPFGYQEGRKYPLVLDIHGGPASADTDSWDNSLNRIWQQKGAFVLQVNYHGSSSYGREWVESIRERYYELEIPDIEAGVDSLIARGLVDPEKMASTGWSNGGILTAELITRTRRYKAAVVGAADVEWLSDWANVDFGAAFDNYYFGGPPWERVQHYIDKSPFFRLGEVTTPTLIHTGTADRNVPPHQSWSLFRALQDIGKAPVRFLTYPGEPHGLQQTAHRRRRFAEDVAWLEKYLSQDGKPRDPAIPPGSPLAGLLGRRQAARDAAARYGVEQDGVLLPELVKFGALEVGRFEVTRAQFAAFEPGFAVAPGDENLPATGITFEKAKAYAAWVAGRRAGVRLPTIEEARALAAKAGDGGNTLDRWLGYGANPEDADSARKAALEAGEGALLLPVGSGSPAREGDDGAAVYDLDGNAAEWATGETKATGKPAAPEAIGPSADRSKDAADPHVTSTAYTGFRLVAAAAKPQTP